MGKQACKGGESRPKLTSFCRSSVFVLEIYVLSQSKVSSVYLGHIRFWKNQELMISRPSHEQTRQTPKVERMEAEGGGGGCAAHTQSHLEPTPPAAGAAAGVPLPPQRARPIFQKGGRKATARVKRAKPNTDTGGGSTCGGHRHHAAPGLCPPPGFFRQGWWPSSPGSGSPAWAPLAWLGPGQRGSCPPSPASASSGHQGAQGQTRSPAREARQAQADPTATGLLCPRLVTAPQSVCA